MRVTQISISTCAVWSEQAEELTPLDGKITALHRPEVGAGCAAPAGSPALASTSAEAAADASKPALEQSLQRPVHSRNVKQAKRAPVTSAHALMQGKFHSRYLQRCNI